MSTYGHHMREVYSQGVRGGRPAFVFGQSWFEKTYALTARQARRMAAQYGPRWSTMTELAKQVTLNAMRRDAE